jgi:hypothetical protein
LYQKRSINAAEYLFDKQRKNGGVNRNQTRERDWKQSACGEECPNHHDNETSRKHHREKKGSRDAGYCRRHEGHEGQGQRNPGQP